MILQALDRYYQILLKDPESDIAPPGFCTTGVSFALNLSTEGELLDLYPLVEKVPRGKKTADVPRRMVVPEQVKRAVNIAANFLCDNATYVLGLADENKKSKDSRYAVKRFEAFRDYNCRLLRGVDSPAARAVVAFLERHDPLKAHEHPVLTAQLDDLLKGGNLVFMVEGKFALEDPQIIQAWEREAGEAQGEKMQCLVTGEIAPIARLHPSIKHVRGAQPIGASLVSFNERAYESYNRTQGQGLNAPVSEQATFAYTTALNYLLSSDSPNPPILLGDTTVVYWAESENRAYSDHFSGIFGAGYQVPEDAIQEKRKAAEERLKKIAARVERGRPLDVGYLPDDLDPDVRFYVLGLAPNASRLSVRFFIAEPFGRIVTRIMQHYADLQIEKEFENQPTFIPLHMILNETVSQKARNPEPAPLLAGSVMRAILNGAPYPAALYSAIITRTRADMDDPNKRIYKINYVRAAVIKAFLIRKYRHQPSHPLQEVLRMSLNESSTIPAYVLGRLFAVLEKVQQEAVGSVNASIKDRYFTSACATPATTFPVLLRLSQHHIAKAQYGYTRDRQIRDLLDMLDVDNQPFPAHLTLDEQGLFILGYYHQRAAFYKKADPTAETATPVEAQ